LIERSNENYPSFQLFVDKQDDSDGQRYQNQI